MTAIAFPERVAAKAASVNFVKLLLTLLSAPFYAVGIVLGVLWMMMTWAISACQVGMEDAKTRGAARRVES